MNLGKGIQALPLTRLAKAGDVKVVERSRIDKVMGEQDFGASGRVKQGTNARIGRSTGSDAIVMGDIVTFGRDDKKKNWGGFMSGLPGYARLASALFKTEEKAVVVLTCRLVDAETSEIIWTGEARGESSRKSRNRPGFCGVMGAGAGVSIEMTSANFAETIIGEAVTAPVDKVAAHMREQAARIPEKVGEVEAVVASVDGGSVYISAGANDGVQAGDRFEVHRVPEKIIHPATGEVLEMKTVPVGSLLIASVRDKVAQGTYSGTEAAQVGMVVRK